MTIKEQLWALLDENRGNYISGEEIAKQLYCTRGAVWKAITALRSEGCRISAVTNRGYCLEDAGDALTAAGIRRFLSRSAGEITVLKTVGSTNVYMRDLAQKGASEGTLVVSAEQTSGSGRRGRRFFSPAETGLYMSILLRPDFSAQEAVRMTSAAAVAVCQAVEETCGAAPQIKWVNDIYINGRKAAGILTEAAFGLENGALEYAVVGIGINVYEPKGGFPEEIRDTAGAVLSQRVPEMRNRLAAAVYERFMAIYRMLPDSGYLSEYRKRLMWCGEEISILTGADGEAKTPAIMLGVDESCALLVRYENGCEGVLSSGEISIRR
ncbi:MAG: biotin--[acetyl-CoA-carboxylase] ligase [Oscillospiraceae bacterium]